MAWLFVDVVLRHFTDMWFGQSNPSLDRIEGIVWVRARLMILNEKSLSVTHFTITPFQYTCYQVVWVQGMLIVLNEFGISTNVLTEKRWIGGLKDSRTNNTLIDSIYLCCIDTLKQLYTPTLGCYWCGCVRPCRWILGSVVSKQFSDMDPQRPQKELKSKYITILEGFWWW